MGYTKKQRDWFNRVYGEQCAFHEFKRGVWRRCETTTKLHIHHILPTRWAKRWVPNFNRDRPLNGILLCKRHHGWLHSDMTAAYAEYGKGNKQAFEEMIAKRDKLVERGEIYWQSQWDWMFIRLVRKAVFRYYRKHPEDKFPK